MDKEELKRIVKDGKELLNELFDYVNTSDSRIEELHTLISTSNGERSLREMKQDEEIDRLKARIAELERKTGMAHRRVLGIEDRLATCMKL